jgi:phosphatidylserine/phosphatidylglycerophosphate/cardiolipin synthase-like enzyme
MEERMTNATLSPETAKEFPELEKYPSISAFSSYVPFAHATNAELTFETNTSHLHGEYGVPGRKDINQTVIERIHGATKFVLIMDSYIILMDEIRDALIDAGKRGVKVVFVTNSPISVDTLSTQIVFDQEWPKMLREIPGSEIFASKLTHDMHSKVLCFDETVCAVGSYNLDFQSGNLNSEDMVFIRSNELNAEVRRAIDDYAEKNTVQYSLQGDEGSNQLNVSEGRRLQLELLAPVGENLRWRL